MSEHRIQDAKALTGAGGLARNVLYFQRMTIHNGPGFRTVVSLKGCPLRCIWCSTPESQKGEAEIAFYRTKCNLCGKCVAKCPLGAINIQDNMVTIDRERCNNCGKCAQVCERQALIVLGQKMSPSEVAKELKKDAVFFKHSGGGVVVSGGEPLLDADFILELVRELKAQGLNVGIDTCGHVPWKNIAQLLPYIDFFLWDVKVVDPNRAKELTGADSRLILNNLRKASAKGTPIYLRYPIIPGYTDSAENFIAIIELAKSLKSMVELHLLPLHHLGKARYESLGRPYPIEGVELIPGNVVQEYKRVAESHSIKCSIQG